MAEWEIHKPLGVCAGAGRSIEPGEEYIATLVETDGRLERKDYCSEYWTANSPAVYCYWKSIMPKPDAKKKIFIDNDMLLAFFERLAAETAEEKVNFRFVLTLILMRKRILKYDSSKTENGTEMWTVKITGRDETAEVVNPHLTEDKIEQLSEQLGQILQVEFNG
ncbi:MAG: hypothetical protein CVV39_06920 [Planctomycetes bacterium HGW-Planctomycetes-1]|nr:MAG: hypothetical protein CVV39_06920 [Planctomycetes bacterium HGW-Planctomycetes-1]